MESLSGNQIQDLKELYKGIYDQTIDETTANLQKLDKEQRDAMKGKFVTITLPDGSTKKAYEGSAEYRKEINKKDNKVEKDNKVDVNQNKDFKNTSIYKSSASNPENFQSKEKQKEYLKLLNDKNVNPMEIDNKKYFKNKEVEVKNNEVKNNEVKKNEVKKKEKPLLSTHIPIVSKTKLGSTVRPVKPGSARDKMIAKNELRHGSDKIVKKREMNADFQRMKSGEITKMDFMKQYPSSQTTKKYNMKQIEMGKPTIKSHYEPYDLVLDYVLSEGHADTIEEAHYVMTQMDAETIQTIVEKGVFQSKVLNKKYDDQPDMTEKGKEILPNLPDPIINGKDYNKKFGISTGSQKALELLKK